MTHGPAYAAALDAYRDAVERRVWQSRSGTYGDGRLDAAREAERQARAAVVAAGNAAGVTA